MFSLYPWQCCADALGVISTSHGELVLDLLTRQVNVLDSYSPIGCSDKRSVGNRAQPSNGPGNLTNASGSVVLNTGIGSSGSSVPKRFTNLFRQHTGSSVSKSDQAYTRPLPAYFGGSVEVVRATILQGFTRSLRHLPIGVSSPHLDPIFKGILEPMSSSPDVVSVPNTKVQRCGWWHGRRWSVDQRRSFSVWITRVRVCLLSVSSPNL